MNNIFAALFFYLYSFPIFTISLSLLNVFYHTGTTFHRVDPPLMHEIRASLDKLRRNADAVASVAMETELLLSSRRMFVTTWNCSVDGTVRCDFTPTHCCTKYYSIVTQSVFITAL